PVRPPPLTQPHALLHSSPRPIPAVGRRGAAPQLGVRDMTYPDPGSRPPADRNTSWVRYVGMGAELAGAVAGFTLLGYWIDAVRHTSPTYTAIGAVLGIIGGMYNFFRTAMKLTREQFGPPAKRDTHKHDDETGRR